MHERGGGRDRSPAPVEVTVGTAAPDAGGDGAEADAGGIEGG